MARHYGRVKVADGLDWLLASRYCKDMSRATWRWVTGGPDVETHDLKYDIVDWVARSVAHEFVDVRILGVNRNSNIFEIRTRIGERVCILSLPVALVEDVLLENQLVRSLEEQLLAYGATMGY